TMADLGTLGGTYSIANAINDGGVVVGQSGVTTASSHPHAFRYTNGVMADLGTIAGDWSSAQDGNSIGGIVGYSTFPGSAETAYHAFLDHGGVMFDLNSLIDPTAGWTLSKANGINDTGQITGSGLINGEQHAFVLTPIPIVPGDFSRDGFVNI